MRRKRGLEKEDEWIEEEMKGTTMSKGEGNRGDLGVASMQEKTLASKSYKVPLNRT